VTDKSYNFQLSEKFIINNFLKKLNLNTNGTFNFENDAAYLKTSAKNKTVVTTDTIVENIDFFTNDPPESIAQKIMCVNLSDISAMGAKPKTYTLNLSINSTIDKNWLKRFTKHLSKIQKKYNMYLLGGDISRSKEINLTITCFGESKFKNIIQQKNSRLGDDIWVTGDLGNSFLGYKIIKNPKLKFEKKHIKKLKNFYFYPEPCMFGSKASQYINSAVDISDGFYGDLQKILHGKFGAKIFRESIPISDISKKILKDNSKKIKFSDILSWGDDYELLFTSFKKNRKKLLNLAKRNKVKISLVGSIVKKTGIYDDSLNPIVNTVSFDHFC
tara:strand:+ start:1886 stop:2875 length:990 start_codon:yes stop_codon:yes gene_type:complete